MGARLLASIIAVTVTLPLGGCELIDKIPPPTSANQPVYSNTDDGWKRSALWLYATEEATGGQAGECALLLELLRGEESCRGPICESGSELATEWLDKCSSMAAEHVDAVRSLEQTFRKRAAEAATPCATEYAALTGSGCQPDTCLERARAWATRCGESEAGALSGAILERRVARRVGSEVEIDLRGCPTLAQQLQQGARCASETECRAALAHVEAYAARCQGDDRRPDLATAVAELAILAGANREPEPLAISPEVQPLAPDALPLVLADGSGAVLSLCHQRPVDLPAFIDLQQRCAGTPLVLGRLFYGKEGTPTVRVGQLPAPAAYDPPSPYPWLELAGERAHYAELEAQALREGLAAVAAAPPDESLAKLVVLIDEHRPWLDVSAAAQQALTEADGKLAPVLTAAAAAKVTGSKRVYDPAALRGLHERSQDRPLADLSRDGKFALGAETAAYWLEPERWLPQAMAAYRQALAPLEQRIRFAPAMLPAKRSATREEGLEQVAACAAAQTRGQAIEIELTRCVFAACEDDRVASLVTEWRQVRDRAAAARIAGDLALSALHSGAERLQLASKRGCEEPGW